MSKYTLSFLLKYIYCLLLAFVCGSCSGDRENTNLIEVKALSEDSIQSQLKSYIYANISYDCIDQKYCDMDKNAILMISRVFKGLDQFEKGNIVKAWEIWDYCMHKMESCKYAAETCFVVGKALGERDLDTALVLLERALQKSRIKGHENRALEYSALNEIITLLSSSANAGSGKDYNIEVDKLVMKYAAEADRLLTDSSFCYNENNASTSIYRISTESILWLGEDSITDLYTYRYLQNKEHYKNPEITEFYIDILDGIKSYIKKDNLNAERLLKRGVEGIGESDSYLNYSLELPYAYLGIIYYKTDNIENSITYMENSIKSLQSHYYSSSDEDFKSIPIDQLESSNYILNIILSYIRLQRCYMRALDLGVESVTFEDLSNLSSYVNQLIKWWCLTAADNETLLFVARLIKQSNEVMIEATYNHSDNTDSDIDLITSMAVEPGSFNLNYLIKLRNFKSNIEESKLFYKKMSELSLEVINKDGQNDSLTYDEILKRLDLFHLKSELIDIDQHSNLVDNGFYPVYIKPGKAIIKYFVSYNYLFIIYHTPEEKGIKRLKLDDLKKNITALKRAIKSGGEFQEFSGQLYDILIDPVKDHLGGVDKLAIVLDELLDGVPFELLQDHNGRYLIEDYSIKYQLSISPEEQNSISPRNYSLLAFASGFEDDSDRDDLYSIFDMDDQREYISKLSPLPHSIDEVNAIGSYFEKDSLNTTIITSSEATKTNFIRNISKHNIIHIATHGISNQLYGSGLFFSQSENDSGFLALHELYQLDINVDLVTLSACKTGVGRVLPGEGVMFLPRGFLCAGAKNVIATLWKINDEKASQMMVLFYRYLLEKNVSYARALQLAKIEMIKQDALPLDWSGFILISE